MNEITFGYTSGRTLTYGVYQPDGTVRTAAGTALTEVAGTGYYRASDAAIQALDFVIVKDSVLGVVGQGQYDTATSALATTAHLQDVEDKLDIVDTNVDTVLSNQNRTLYTFDETEKGISSVPTVALPQG